MASAVVYTTNDISTYIVLSLDQNPLRVLSDRAFIHHELVDGQLKIYVPLDQQQRRACYRSQLPGLLTNIMGISTSATFNISSIISCALADLYDILLEQDVPTVSWIERPVIEIPEPQRNELPRTPPPASQAHSLFDESDASTVVENASDLLTPTSSHDWVQTSPSESLLRYTLQRATPTQYPRLIEHVVQSAQRASYRFVS